MTNKSKYIIQIIAKILVVFVIAAIAAVVTEHYLFPRLSAAKLFSKYQLFKQAAENVTIINKTEQVIIKEDDSINTIAGKAASAVVNIISTSAKAQPAEKNAIKGKSGTGMLAANDGLIVTYRAAIIEKEATYKILLFDGSIRDATLQGVDEFTNLAYFRINASNLPAISFADSSDFRAGKKLVAIGNSGGEYQNRFSAGLLSSLNKTFNIAGKTVSSSEKMEGVFETDFASQEEYLGGPVINYNGELVGITGSVIVDNQEKFFQIPSNAVKSSVEAAIKNELDSRPALGVYYIPITKKYSIVNNLSRDKGALIFSPSGKQGLAVILGSAAEKAGLEINDIIVSVNNKEINSDNPLSNLLSQYQKNDEVEFLVIRSGQEMKIKVKI